MVPLPNKDRVADYFMWRQDVSKEGYDPVKDEKVMTQRKELIADYEIPFGEEYRDFVLGLLENNKEI